MGLSMPTETHGKYPWVCVAIKHNTLVPRSHAKFHGIRSELNFDSILLFLLNTKSP